MSLVIFPFLEGNCPEMISETKKLLKVNGKDFECEPLGKFCLVFALHFIDVTHS